MPELQRLLFVDPEGNNENDLPTSSFDVIYTRTKKAAIEKLRREKPFGVIIVTSNPKSARSILDSLYNARHPKPIVVVNEAKKKEDALEVTKAAMKHGASDVILSLKPTDIKKALMAFPESKSLRRILKATPPKSEIRLLRESLGLSRRVFADLLPASAKAVQNWEEGAALPRKSHDRMAKLLEVKQRLEGLYEPDEVARWIKTPNSIFGMKRPIDLIMKGDFEVLLNMIESLEDGSHA